MKTSRNIISVLIAAGAPGVALLTLSNQISAEVGMVILSVGGLLAFAAFDYTRTAKSLRTRAQVMRPSLATAKVCAPVACTLDRAA
jgi:hypothetical protein